MSIHVCPWLESGVLAIIHEDDDLMVVNKPAGLVCHPTKNGEMSSLVGRARLYLGANPPTPTSNSETPDPRPDMPRPYLINRLDRETSGIVLIAKSSAVAGELGKALENRLVEKEYLAIVHGHVKEDHGTIDAALGKDECSIVAVKDCVRPDGAAARTEYFVEKRFGRVISGPGTLNVGPETHSQPFSLLRVIPHTGRKHQIRIHLAYIGHPIVGDKLYGGDEDCYLALAQDRLTDAQRAKLILENHALHAQKIRFPWRGKSAEFSCEPENEFKTFFDTGADLR